MEFELDEKKFAEERDKFIALWEYHRRKLYEEQPTREKDELKLLARTLVSMTTGVVKWKLPEEPK